MGATVSVYAGTMDCYRDVCGQHTRVITDIDVRFGPNTYEFSLKSLGDYPELAEAALARIPQGIGLGPIRLQPSNMYKSAYLSNGCRACGSLMGDFYLHKAYCDEEIIAAFPQALTGSWHRAIETRLTEEGAPMAWGVYET